MTTITIKQILEYEKTITHEKGKLTLKNILNTFPLYKESHRKEFIETFIEHFYFREIGYSTYQRFLFKLNAKFLEIMPYYNQRYKSCDIEYNPLFNIDITESYQHQIQSENSNNSTSTDNTSNSSNSENSNESNSTNSENSNSLNVHNDTPNQELSDDDINSNKYATDTQHDKATNSSSSTNSENSTSKNSSSSNSNSTIDSNGNQNTIETYKKKTLGSSAGLAFSTAIKKDREIYINVDMEIINEIDRTEFLQIYPY